MEETPARGNIGSGAGATAFAVCAVTICSGDGESYAHPEAGSVCSGGKFSDKLDAPVHKCSQADGTGPGGIGKASQGRAKRRGLHCVPRRNAQGVVVYDGQTKNHTLLAKVAS